MADNSDRIPVHIWLIYQLGLRCPISSLLKEVIAHCRLTFMQVCQLCLYRARGGYDNVDITQAFQCGGYTHVYTVVRPKREPDNPLYEGNHYLRLRRPDQPQTRLVTGNPDKDLFLDEFVWVSGSWEFQAGDDGLWSFPRYNGHFPNIKYSFH